MVAQVSSVEFPSTKMSSVRLPMSGVRSMAAWMFPASFRAGTTTLTLMGRADTCRRRRRST